jgi:hypothetical protein
LGKVINLAKKRNERFREPRTTRFARLLGTFILVLWGSLVLLAVFGVLTSVRW